MPPPVISENHPRSFVPFDRQAEFSQTRRHLPHWAQASRTYYVTWRLADSLPQEKLRPLLVERDDWVKEHPQPWSDEALDEYERRFTERMQEWMDAGYGACVLRESRIRALVESALRHFDGDRYMLDGYTAMPNHVHVLVKTLGEHSLDDIVHSWKSFMANRINRALNRSGALWMDERFDHIVRSGAQLRRFREYIRGNPEKAHLSADEACVGQGIGLVE